MIAEGMWDGNIADSAEIYAALTSPSYKFTDYWNSTKGMNLDQSLRTIEHLYGVQVQTDSNGNLDFS